MLHATLRSLKNSGPLGTHAAVYGLSSLCVTLHPAQSVTTILQHSPSAVPARRARARAQSRAARSPSRSYRAQRSLAHRFACRPSRSSRLTRALWAPIAQRREGPKTKGRVAWLCMWPALSRPSCAGRQRCAPPRRGWRPWSPGARPWPWLRRLSWWSQEP
jgi:hypothetical protein